MQYKIEMPLITDLRKHVVCCYFSINFVFKCYLILCMSVIGNVHKMQNCKRNISSTSNVKLLKLVLTNSFVCTSRKQYTTHSLTILNIYNDDFYIISVAAEDLCLFWFILLEQISYCCSCWVSVRWWWQALESCTRGGCVLASCYLYWRRHLRWVCVGTVQELYIYPLKVSSN